MQNKELRSFLSYDPDLFYLDYFPPSLEQQIKALKESSSLESLSSRKAVNFILTCGLLFGWFLYCDVRDIITYLDMLKP